MTSWFSKVQMTLKGKRFGSIQDVGAAVAAQLKTLRKEGSRTAVGSGRPHGMGLVGCKTTSTHLSYFLTILRTVPCQPWGWQPPLPGGCHSNPIPSAQGRPSLVLPWFLGETRIYYHGQIRTDQEVSWSSYVFFSSKGTVQTTEWHVLEGPGVPVSHLITREPRAAAGWGRPLHLLLAW